MLVCHAGLYKNFGRCTIVRIRFYIPKRRTKKTRERDPTKKEKPKRKKIRHEQRTKHTFTLHTQPTNTHTDQHTHRHTNHILTNYTKKREEKRRTRERRRIVHLYNGHIDGDPNTSPLHTKVCRV